MASPPGEYEDSEEHNHGQQKNETNRPRQRLMCELLLDFSKNSTLHGLRYVTDRGLSAIEKTFWGMVFITSVCLCAWAMSKVWLKWQNSPIIVTVNDQLMSASEVPFPAVTICPQVKINQRSFNYTKHWITYQKFMKQLNEKGITEIEREEQMKIFMEQTPFMIKFANMNLLCSHLRFDMDLFPFMDLGHTLVQNIKQVAPDIEDTMWYAEWRSKSISNSLKAYLAPVLMAEGVCFTFNGLAADEIFHMDRIQRNYTYLDATIPSQEWSPEVGYPSSDHIAYPRRGQASTLTSDLLLNLKEIWDPDLLCDGNKGYKIYLHHPADLPQTSRNFHALQAQEHVHFAVKVNAMTTSDTLAKYPSLARQCYFASEKELRYFKTYTPSNCRLECLTNHTFMRCGCVEFHMPHNTSTDLCVSVDKLSCVTKALIEHSANEDGFGNRCKCFPTCNSVQYEAEVTKRTFDSKPQQDVENQAWDQINNVSTPPVKRIRRFITMNIEMYFKEAAFVTLRRSELFGATDFLANCGGLLGLFLGFSFLSLVELFFYFIIRLGCMFRQHSGTDEIVNANNIPRF